MGRVWEIDPGLSEARTVMAMIKGSFDHDLHGAEREARAAIEGHPNYPRARQALIRVLLGAGAVR